MKEIIILNDEKCKLSDILKITNLCCRCQDSLSMRKNEQISGLKRSARREGTLCQLPDFTFSWS